MYPPTNPTCMLSPTLGYCPSPFWLASVTLDLGRREAVCPNPCHATTLLMRPSNHPPACCPQRSAAARHPFGSHPPPWTWAGAWQARTSRLPLGLLQPQHWGPPPTGVAGFLKCNKNHAQLRRGRPGSRLHGGARPKGMKNVKVKK